MTTMTADRLYDAIRHDDHQALAWEAAQHLTEAASAETPKQAAHLLASAQVLATLAVAMRSVIYPHCPNCCRES